MPRDEERNGLEVICRQCPAQCLRSQCPHTAEGREYLKKQRSTEVSPLPSAYNWLLPHSGPNAAHPWNAYPWQFSRSPIDPTLVQNGVANTSSLSSMPLSSSGDSQASAPTNASEVAASIPESSSNQSLSSPDPEPDSDSDTAPPHGTQRRQRLRASKKNPIHGMVDGARRGNQLFKVFRSKALRPALSEQAEASARFLRCVSDIIDRCERVSIETGCWLHFSAQHLFGQGGYLHYTSPRFLREAKADAEQIINHFNQTFATLLAARHQDSKDMHRRLLLAEENKQAADAALALAQQAEQNAIRQTEAAQRERDLQAQEIAAQRLELEALKARLALAQRKNGTQE